MRAAAQLHWRDGASAIHLFNFDCHATGIQPHNTQERVGLEDVPLFSPSELRALHEIGDADLIERKDKRYTVPHDMAHRTRSEGGEAPLPAVLEDAGDTVDIGLRVADDMDDGAGGGAAPSAQLRVTAEGLGGRDRLILEWNGDRLDATATDTQLVCEDVLAREGDNHLCLTLEERDPEAESALRVEGVELIVSYTKP